MGSGKKPRLTDWVRALRPSDVDRKMDEPGVVAATVNVPVETPLGKPSGDISDEYSRRADPDAGLTQFFSSEGMDEWSDTWQAEKQRRWCLDNSTPEGPSILGQMLAKYETNKLKVHCKEHQIRTRSLRMTNMGRADETKSPMKRAILSPVVKVVDFETTLSNNDDDEADNDADFSDDAEFVNNKFASRGLTKRIQPSKKRTRAIRSLTFDQQGDAKRRFYGL